MTETGAQYDEVLKKAQELGFAEADPTEDVSGKDAAAKMAILSSIGFHSRTTLADVPHEGITCDHGRRHRPRDLARLRHQAARRRQAHRRPHERACLPRVRAAWTTRWRASRGAYNAVFLESEHFDKIMLYGPGAGSVPTASAVIGDIIERHQHRPGRLRPELHLLQAPRVLPERRRGERASTSGCR